jgi:hypothetical protein
VAYRTQGKRADGGRWASSARSGASKIAPTAPHATEPLQGLVGPKKKATGPEKFWNARRVQVALGAALTASLAVHYILSPWTLFPKPAGIDFKDVADELAIPIDMIGEEPEAPPPPPPEQAPPPPSTPGEGAGLDAGARTRDAGPRDAAPLDASGTSDAMVASENKDAAAIALADRDAAISDFAATDGGVLVASGSDAGGGVPGAGGPRTPAEMLGMSNIVTAGKVNVTLLVNLAVIRQHPVGARMSPLLTGIPQWNDFIHGAETKLDPLQATDWIFIFGPSLIHTDRDAVFVRLNIPDAQTDRIIDTVSRLSTTRGGAFDAGVPGIHAAKTFADNGDRVMMRLQPGVVLVVPPDKAPEFARVYKRASIPTRVRPNEAMRMTVVDPWRQISIPNLKFPNTLSELRFWIIPHNDDGTADVYGEGDCGTPDAAKDVADVMREIVRRQNSSMLVRIATRGLLNGMEIEPQGSQVKLHLPANREQLEALLGLVAAQLGVQVAPAPGASGTAGAPGAPPPQ